MQSNDAPGPISPAGGLPSRLGRLQAALQAVLDDKSVHEANHGAEHGADAGISSTVEALRSEVADFVSTAQQQQPLAQAEVEALWRLCCDLWNTCVEATNSSSVTKHKQVALNVAWLRHSANELVALAADAHVSEEEHIARLQWCVKAAQAWTDLGALEQAEVMLSLASRHSAAFESLLQEPTTPGSKRERYLALLLGVYTQRLENAWKLRHQALASQMLGLARSAALELGRAGPCLNLISTLHSCAMAGEAAQEEPGDAVALLSAAYELVGHVKGMAGQDGAPQEVQELEHKVLLGLACCHIMAAGKADIPSSELHHGLQAIKQLRQLPDNDTSGGTCSHPAVALLALKALLAEGIRVEEAEAEATGIVVHDAADEGTCCQVVEVLASTPGVRVTGLRAVVELAQSRYPDNGSILTSFITAALSPDTTHQRSVTAEVQGLVLEVLGRSDEARQAVLYSDELRPQVCCALFNHALACFEVKQFEACVKFCSAVMDFAEADLKGRAARMAALCHIGLSELPQALEAAELSDKHQPRMVGASFIRFKALLEMGRVEDVKGELARMMACVDFDEDLLKVACQEALTCNALPVAKEALLKLHAMLAAAADNSLAASSDAGAAAAAPADGTSPEHAPGANGAAAAGAAAAMDGASKEAQKGAAAAANATTPEALVLRTLIMCITRELSNLQQQAQQQPRQQQQQQEKQQGQQDHAHSDASAHDAAAAMLESFKELAGAFGLVSTRLAVLGVDRFMGEGDAKVPQHLEWFAVAAWNAALHASDARAYQSCALLMHACTQLLGRHPNPTTQIARQLKVAHLLAASAALEVHKQHPEDSASLRWAAKMIEEGQAAAAALGAAAGAAVPGSKTAGGPAAGAAVVGAGARGTAVLAGGAAAGSAAGAASALVHGGSSGGDLSDVCACLTAFSVATRLRDRKLQAAVLERCEALGALSAEHALKLVALCNQEDQYRDLDIALAAHKLAMRKLLACAEPDFCALALVVRQAVQAAPADLELIREAKELLDTLPIGAWPQAERQWLLATTFNRGLHHAKFQRPALAAEYMQLALGLLRHCPECPKAEDRRRMMTQLLAEVTGQAPPAGKAAVEETQVPL